MSRAAPGWAPVAGRGVASTSGERIASCGHALTGYEDAMHDMLRMDSNGLIALSHAIDAPTDRGDIDETIRLSSLQGPEPSRWLEPTAIPA